LILVVSTYIIIARHFKIVDQPNSRSSHSKVTIRGGGIIFPIGALIWFFLSGFQYPMFFLGLIIISIISFWDDIKQQSTLKRLIFQSVAVILLFSDIGFQNYSWWIWILVFILSIGIINAYNFMDGINGITGAYSLSVIAGLCIINTFQQNFIDSEFIYIISISVTIFCFLNFRKRAICFGGDVGSVSIAFIIVFLMFKLINQTANPLYLLLLSVYGIDSILTILVRLWNNENIFEAHRKHLYQLMANELKIQHIIVASIYSILQILICLLIFNVINANFNSYVNLIIGLSVFISLILIYTILRNKINEMQLNNKEKLLFKKINIIS